MCVIIIVVCALQRGESLVLRIKILCINFAIMWRNYRNLSGTDVLCVSFTEQRPLLVS